MTAIAADAVRPSITLCHHADGMGNEADTFDDALARARSGDEAGFLQLWRELHPRLLRYLRVLSSDDADDVASETWLQVVRDLHRFDGGADDFRCWLFTIGRHRAVDAARARVRARGTLMAADVDWVADGHLVEIGPGRGALTPSQAFGAKALLDGLAEAGVSYGVNNPA